MKIDIAFLDSGTGGLPYMLYLKRATPNKNCVYVGDTKNFPYGEKTKTEVIDCVKIAVEKIIRNFDPKVIVLACNTMSVSALKEIRKEFSIPFVGTVPAIKLAASITKNHRIGLLATERAVQEEYTKSLINDFASDSNVFCRGDGELIRFIEKEILNASEKDIKNAIQPAVDFFTSKEVDTVILGCTHFIHVAKEISEAMQKNVMIIDSRDGVTKQALKLSSANEKENQKDIDIQDQSFFITSDIKEDEKHYKELAKKLNIPWAGFIS